MVVCLLSVARSVIEGLNESLRRLQMDYVDIVYAHRCAAEWQLLALD